MKILLLSRYDSLGASSRVRFFQYLNYLRRNGLTVDVVPLLSNVYLERLYTQRERLGEILGGYTRRLVKLIQVLRYDVLIIEKELFPFLPATAERLLKAVGVPYLVDYDDAWFHRYDQHRNPLIRALLKHKIDTVMCHAAVVVVGNSYLAERAKQAGAKDIEIIPTVVDTTRYTIASQGSEGVPVVGWIGTPKTSHYLVPLMPVFQQLKEAMPVRFVAVGARPENFAGTLVEVWPWSEEKEIAMIQQFDVGIMPLDDTPWERGKCGYKLIQYMACGVPVVASPVGVNKEIISHGQDGFLARTLGEWKDYLEQMLRMSRTQRQSMGLIGRSKVECSYSLQTQAPRFMAAVLRAAEPRQFP